MNLPIVDTEANIVALASAAIIEGYTYVASDTGSVWLGVNGVLVFIGGKGGNLAATGTNQATAAAIVNHVTNVTAADGTKAVRLPSATAAGLRKFTIYNSVATNGLPIFPASGETIDGGSANAAITLEGKNRVDLVSVSATNWAASDFTVDS